MINQKAYLLLFFKVQLFIISATLYAQEADYQPGVSMDKDVKILSSSNLVWLEPAIAVHPKKGKLLIAASFSSEISDRNQETEEIGILRSEDGGNTWENTFIDCINCSDPWISITDKGIVFLTVLGRHPGIESEGKDQLMIFSSMDEGNTWSTVPQSFEGGHDGPRSIVAPDGTVYVGSTLSTRDKYNNQRSAIVLLRAEPGETNFSLISTIIPSNLALNFDMFSVLSDGTLYVSYFDFQRKMDGGFRSREGRLKSRRSWCVFSKDRGKTFQPAQFITEETGFRPNMLNSHMSKNYGERLYHVSMSLDLKRVIYTYSKDKGEEWNHINLRDSSTNETRKFFPNVAINKNGVVAVTWIENCVENKSCYAPYITFSFDGGETFIEPVMLSSEKSFPDFEKVDAAGRWQYGGDYFGIITDTQGNFHIVWPDARTGKFEIWYTSIRVGM